MTEVFCTNNSSIIGKTSLVGATYFFFFISLKLFLLNIIESLLCTHNPFIYARKKGVHEVMKKLRAHPLCVSVYAVYCARVMAG